MSQQNPFEGIFTPGGQRVNNPMDPRTVRNPYGELFRTPPLRSDGAPAAPAAPQAPSAGGSAIDRYYQMLMDQMPSQRQTGLSDIGSLLGSFASDQRTNRTMAGNAYQSFDQMMLDRELARNRMGLDAQTEFDRLRLAAGADKRESDSDAMRKLQLAGWLGSGGNASAPGGSHRAVSDAERQAAGSLSTQTMDQLNRPAQLPTRFDGNWDYVPMDPGRYAQPGIAERAGSWGGAVTGGLSALDMLLGGAQGGNGIGGLLSKIPGLSKLFGNGGAATSSNVAGTAANAGSRIGSVLGKVAPIAGAVTGGIGLMKDRGLGGNVMNGATTGASIGSIVPGLGTAIGAGIGGLVGALRGVNWGGGPSNTERAGRDVASQVRSALTSSATAQQQAEAAASGQGEQALLHIVMRDRLGEQAAGNVTRSLFEAEKQGPEAVAQVISQLQGMRA